MAASTQTRNTKERVSTRQPVLGNVQKAGTTIYAGTAAVHVAGVFQPLPVTPVNGMVYVGIAERTYDCSGEGSNYTWGTPMVFRRHPHALDGKAGDLPTAADLGKLVPMADDHTVMKTTATDVVTVRLLEIEGTRYWVEPA